MKACPGPVFHPCKCDLIVSLPDWNHDFTKSNDQAFYIFHKVTRFGFECNNFWLLYAWTTVLNIIRLRSMTNLIRCRFWLALITRQSGRLRQFCPWSGMNLPQWRMMKRTLKAAHVSSCHRLCAIAWTSIERPWTCRAILTVRWRGLGSAPSFPSSCHVLKARSVQKVWIRVPRPPPSLRRSHLPSAVADWCKLQPRPALPPSPAACAWGYLQHGKASCQH